MTTKEKKRKIFNYVVMALMIGGIYLILSNSNIKWLGAALFALSFILLLINSIGAVYYSKASKYLKSSNPDIYKALPYLEKAVKRGVDPQSEVVAATLFVQYGDKEKGKDILEEYVNSSDKKIKATAGISLSMYYWVKRDLDKAIETATTVYETGYRDRNLLINLLTFYLEKGMYKEFEKLLKESKKLGLNEVAVLDLEASYYLSLSEWAKCGAKLEKLFSLIKPQFIDPYLHQAFVYLHYGEWEDAAKSLKAIKTNVQLINTSIYTEAQIDTLIAYVEDKDTRWGLWAAVEEDPGVLIRKEMPEVKPGTAMPEFEKKPDFKTVIPEEIAEKDESDIDTSLTDEDEEWIRKHSK